MQEQHSFGYWLRLKRKALDLTREAINEPLPLTFQKDYAASVTQARTQLGEEVYASAWSEGYAMSPEQANALAFEE